MIALLLVVLLCAGCRQEEMTVTRTEFLLDTFVTVTLYGSGDEEIISGVMELCRTYDAMLDRHSPDSEVARLNAAGEGVVSPPLYELLALALEYCALSGGVYDITVAPVMDLWDFKTEEPTVPAPEEIRRALDQVGWERVELSEGFRVTLAEGAQVDLGSIAKGYIADRMGEYLREKQVPGAIINLGGNVLTVGTKAGGAPFEIGVQKPFEDREEIVGSLKVTDLSMVSSGVYERFFYEGETLYHHIIDATTGYPAHSDLLSVTVICPSSARADALSTLCFLLGREEAVRLLESLPETEGVFLGRDGITTLTGGLEGEYREIR